MTTLRTPAGTVQIGDTVQIQMARDEVATITVTSLDADIKGDRGNGLSGTITAYDAAPYRVGRDTWAYDSQVVAITR